MTDRNILAFHQLAPYIYGLKSASLGLAAEVPAGLDDVDTPEKAVEWLKGAGDLDAGPSSRKLYPLKSIFPDISLGENKETNPVFYYRPSPLSPNSLMPVSGQPAGFGRSLKDLWQKFLEGIDRFPKVAKSNTSVWLDCLIGAWQSVSWCLSDSDKGPSSMIPLYEKSRVATVLNGIEEESVLLIQGDFQGIQDFIFTRGSSVNRKSAKLLRGRSFYVSLITELAALAVLEKLGLSSINLVNQAAGKFLIIAPNTEENNDKLKELTEFFGQWFIENTLATSNLSLAWVNARKEDLQEDSSSFAEIMHNLFDENEISKLRRPLLVERDSPVLNVDYSKGVSEYDERQPKESLLIKDQILTGDKLVKSDLLCITRKPIPNMESSRLSIFGYHFTFLGREELDKVGVEVVRLWDFSLPESFDEALFKGIARRDFNGYVARFTYPGEANEARYKIGSEYEYDEEDKLKTFEHLACEDRTSVGGETNRGIVALGVLKGDVDNLGKIFREGLNSKRTGQHSSLCRMLTVSRMLQSFFTIYLPTLCKVDFPNTYTVFAGGDDFFLLGPWHGIQDLAFALCEKFRQFVTNDEVHFSAGIVLVKPAVPPRTLARLSEEALSKAKKEKGKNSVCIYSEVVPWQEVTTLRDVEQQLEFLQRRFDISSAFLYNLFEIMDLAEREEKDKDPQAAIWRSRLSYNTARLSHRKKVDSNELLSFMVNNIARLKSEFRIPLSNFFYRIRNS